MLSNRSKEKLFEIVSFECCRSINKHHLQIDTFIITLHRFEMTQFVLTR